MKKIELILACIDFSDYSLMTLEHAAVFARSLDARILVLNVLNERDNAALEAAARYYPPVKQVETILKEMEEDRYATLRKMVRDCLPEDKSRVTLKVVTGIPSEVILNTAEAEGVDLIMIANKGRSNLSRVLFGSVAEKVIRHSKVTVVSVRDSNTFKRNG